MTTIRIPNNWSPRKHQLRLWTYLEQGGKRAIEIAHRRWGKDDVCLHWAAVSAMQRPASYWHCLPEFAQARKAIWTAINPHTGKRRIDEAFPHAIRENTNDQEMFIRFKNGATFQLVGSDRYDNLVGAGVAGVTFSEWALGNPSAWGYIRPMVEENNGWAAFITTPRGRNHAKAMFDMAQKNPKWFSEISNVHHTGALSVQQLDESLAEYQSLYGEDVGRAQFEQEYLCSFNAAILGAFYAKEMTAVRSEGRIVAIEPIKGRPVHRAWDIGVKDDTSIWWFQMIGGVPYILDCYTNHGAGVDHYAEVCRERGWEPGIDYVPHDAKVMEWGGARTRLEAMIAHGLKPQVIPLASKLDGINAARMTLKTACFHPRTEEKGIAALEMYRREWDDERKMFSANEVRDWSTHLCLDGASLVKTPLGDVRLENIRKGDLVCTPAGPAVVSFAGKTKQVAELYEIILHNGRVLKCTGEHPIFTRRGVVRADELRYLDCILTQQEASWLAKSLNLKARSIGYRDAITAIPDLGIYIEKFGKAYTARSQISMIFITLTAMGQTIRSLTLSAFQWLSTAGCTPSSASPAAISSRRRGKLWPRRLSGMGPQKDCNFTVYSESKLGKIANGFKKVAKSAAENMQRHSQANPNSVISIAKCPHLDVAGGNQWVYDLTVEKHHCYWANGILVSNCDAFRYLSLAWRQVASTVPPEKAKIPGVKPNDIGTVEDVMMGPLREDMRV